MSSTNQRGQREQRLLENLTDDLLLGALHFLKRVELCTLELVNRRLCSLITMLSTQNILGQMHVVFDVEVNHYPAYAPISHQTTVMCDSMGAKRGPIKPVPTRAVPWLVWKGFTIRDDRLIDAEVEAFLREFSQQVASAPCCIPYQPKKHDEDKASVSDELRKALGLITSCCHISIYGNSYRSDTPEARAFFDEGVNDIVVTWLHAPTTTDRKRHVCIMDVLDNEFVRTLHATLLQKLREATTRCPSYLLKAFGVRGREFAIEEAADSLRWEEFNEQTGESLLLQATYCDDLLDRRSFTYRWTRDIQK